MIDKSHTLEIKNGATNYTGWRGELLAELALARVPELSVHKPKEELGYDFLVATSAGTCFFVEVRAFSSKKLRIDNVADVAALIWRVETDRVERAKHVQTPVFLFLIDADTDHGRFARLDTLEPISKRSATQPIRFPVENTIDKAGVERLVGELEASSRVATR